MLQVRELEKWYETDHGPVKAVDGISFATKPGEFYTLLGPSGCGKTTTLRCVAGLEKPHHGEIRIGEDTVYSSWNRTWVAAHRRDVGMVFQSYAIWPHMNVFNNVAYPLVHGRRKIPRKHVKEVVERALRLVQLDHLANRPAPMLSGGQQQRVALARALALEPKLLLLDEPLSNLDAKLREEMRVELKQLVLRLRITTLYVTHDQTEALSMSERVAVMYNGRIVQEGAPRDIYLQPTNSFTASFIGKTNLLEGELLHKDGSTGVVNTPCGQLLCTVPDGISQADSVMLSVRPESVRLLRERPRDDRNVLEGSVRIATFEGDVIEAQVQVADGRILRAKLDANTFVQPGDQVYVYIPPERCRLIHKADGQGHQVVSQGQAISA